MTGRKNQLLLACLTLCGVSHLSAAATTDTPARLDALEARVKALETRTAASSPAGSPGSGSPLLLVTGEERDLALDFEANAGANGISVGNPRLLAVTLVKVGTTNQLLFRPQAVGATTVTVRDRDGTIRARYDVQITARNLFKIQEEVTALLKTVPGVQARISGTKVAIDGDAESPEGCGRALSIANDPAYRDSVLYLVKLSPAYFPALARRMETEIRRIAPRASVRLAGGSFWLEGTVKDADEASRAAEMAKSLLPGVLPADALVMNDPGAKVLPPRSMLENFLKVENRAGP